MERVSLLLVAIAACWAAPQDMSGKMFTFPQDSDTTYVKLIPTGRNFVSVTVCLRYFIDLRRDMTLFSMASPSHYNDFLFLKAKTEGVLHFFNKNVQQDYKDLPDLLYTWMSVCGTWESSSGLIQLWTNGKPSTKRSGNTGGVLDGVPIIILGQDQDSYGGGFAKDQSFLGSIRDVHMWDYVLSPCEIQRFTSDLYYTPGNVLNWRALTYTTAGTVVVEQNQGPCTE